MATKADVGRLENRLDTALPLLATKNDLLRLELRLIRWVVGVGIGGVVVIASLLLKFAH